MIESTGILVKYADFDDLEETNKVVFNGYGYADSKNRPVFVLNGNHSFERRRETVAYLLGKVILNHNWLPSSLEHNVSKEIELVYIDGDRDLSYIFMRELLLPEVEMKEFIDKLEIVVENEMIRNYIAINTLSKAYKVTDELIIEKLKEEDEHGNT